MNHPVSRLILLFVVTLLAACQSSQVEQRSVNATPDAVKAIREINKSPNDTRDYRYLELANELKVVLISDPDADKAAASLTVFRGSFQDPVDRPGLAHFLEHMLFIGTAKYPEADGYFKYVQAHGGGSNAYTATDHTNFFFDIQPDAFPEGLDRFAQFFITPLFQKEYVQREKNAVDSEYQSQLKEDGWRSFAVQKMASNPEHPISSFNIGTLTTLSGDVHTDLLKFFAENYSANQMSLVVLSNQSLDEMQPWITDLFLPIPNHDLPEINVEKPMFVTGQLPATLRFNNIRDEFGLSFTFPMPATATLYRKKPIDYLANLIGHEGDGSLHKLLNSKGWIKALSAGGSDLDDTNSVMNINISLTHTGAENIDAITGYVFAYLDLLKNDDIEEWLYQEQARVAELGFRFSEKTSAINAVRSIAPALAKYPPEDVLIAPYLMETFDAALIRSFLSRMTRDNVLLAVSAPGYTGQQTEPWFGVSYDLEHGPVAMAPVSGQGLALPAPNPFLPESLVLVAEDSVGPLPVMSAGELEIYLDTDLEFQVPRAVTHVSLRSEGGLVGLVDSSNAQLYSRLVGDSLNALAYPALLAGVSYEMVAAPKGFRLSVGGYHDKQLMLLDELLDRTYHLAIAPDRFAVIKGELLRDLANTVRERPYVQGYNRLKEELDTSDWSAEAMMAEVDKITPESLAAWRDKALARVSVQALIHGNVTRERAEQLAQLLKQRITLGKVTVGEPQVLPVGGAMAIPVDIDHDDASMVLYVQDDSDSNDERAKSALLTHLLAPGYFSTLRTEQQLGYIVTAVNTVLRQRGGISFIIQSPVAGPDTLRDRTLDFMTAEEARLADMSAEEFGANKGGLITKLTQRDKNLAQRTGRYWSDLDRGVTTFDSNMQLAEAVSKLSQEDVQAYLRQVNQKLGNQYVLVFSEGRFAEPE